MSENFNFYQFSWILMIFVLNCHNSRVSQALLMAKYLLTAGDARHRLCHHLEQDGDTVILMVWKRVWIPGTAERREKRWISTPRIFQAAKRKFQPPKSAHPEAIKSRWRFCAVTRDTISVTQTQSICILTTGPLVNVFIAWGYLFAFFIFPL